MHVLVTAASRHGATTEIAEAIRDTLDSFEVDGIHATVADPADVVTLDGVDAVVLGSAVYAGHWLAGATAFVERLAGELATRPVWLFSSGPVGDPPMPGDDAVEVAQLMAVTGARGHEVFSGRIDKSLLKFTERAIVVALRVPEGDFRDFEAIADWTRGIAAQLVPDRSGTSPA